MSNNNSTTLHNTSSNTETELKKRYHDVYDKLFDAHLQILVTNNAVIKYKYNSNCNCNSNYNSNSNSKSKFTMNDIANSDDIINDTPDDDANICASIASREAYKQLAIAYNNTLNININSNSETDTETKTDFSKSCDTSELLIKTRIAITNYYSS